MRDHSYQTCVAAPMRIPGVLVVSALLMLGVISVSGAERLGETERRELIETVKVWNQQYDPEAKMIRRPFSSPGYHTTLKGGDVHPTRDSLDYAVALLDTAESEWQTRAEDILRKVISLQDQDPASKTYGIWSWFLEEALDKMSPPDWNWADFCGVRLLQVALYHRARLPADLAEKLDASIRHAARSIQRRNVGPGYTNIAIMGSYVTLVAAELYNLEDLKDYAIQRLQRFHAYTMEQGAFTEYNSPTYTIVALQEIGRLRLQAKDPEARRLAEDIYRVAWQEIASHFHPPTRQWAGPHSRCYSTLLPERVLALVQHSTGDRVRFFDKAPPLGRDEVGLPLPCPRDLEPFFTGLNKSRELVKTFVRGQLPVIGTTYLAPEFALGSINRGDLWNQRRALVAYWGTPEKPSYLHLRFLHDDYDFADAQFFSVQSGGTVVAGVVLGTDGGDTHVSLDRIKNGTILAKDLRLRFEFGGQAGFEKPQTSGEFNQPVLLRMAGLDMSLQVGFARLGDFNGRFEATTDARKQTSALDVVFYSGKPLEFRLEDLKQAAAGFCLNLFSGQKPAPGFSARIESGTLKLVSTAPALQLSIPLKPSKVGELQKAVRWSRN